MKHTYPIRGKSNQSKLVQVNCIKVTRVQSGTKGSIILEAPQGHPSERRFPPKYSETSIKRTPSGPSQVSA